MPQGSYPFMSYSAPTAALDFVHLTVIHHSAKRFQFGSTVCECSHKKTETLKDGSGPEYTPTIPEFRSAGRRLQSEDYFLFAQGVPFIRRRI
ncbi:hypothetical protein J6590_089698 [Homalodisca vitripennis]|nr:hypothetical protein J6590_089698 [Homalodisca vitripennis]